MIHPNIKAKAFSSPVFRPVFHLIASITAVFFIAVLLMVWLSWRNVYRIDPIQQHLDFLTQLQQIDAHFQEYYIQGQNNSDITSNVYNKLMEDLGLIISQDKMLQIDSRNKLKSIQREITPANRLSESSYSNSRNIIHDIITEEIKLHNNILKEMSRNAQFEFYLSLIVTVIFVTGLILFFYLFRNQIMQPLRNLSGFISLLAERKYKTMPMENIEPLLQPLFLNYNNMVLRLAELEKEHTNRHNFLEYNIRQATKVLVEQQRSLARSERLAILGELVASFAHELRNPLAGVQMALVNLVHDLDDEKQKQRLELVTTELARISRFLNDILKQSRHNPEEPSKFSMHAMIGNLVNLACYQMPTGVEISFEIRGKDNYILPQQGLRQALLNLVVNASQAITETPGKIQIIVQREAEYVVFSVQDNGPGFPEKMLNSNIHPFVSWKENGTGLGMAIVRRFTNNLHGEFKIENIAPHGARVQLLIPYKDHD